MKFTSVLKKLILENSRFKVLYDKMVTPTQKSLEKNPRAKGLMSFDILKQIIFSDPDTKAPENFDIDGASLTDMDNVKVGKFTQWMLKNFVAPSLTEEMKSMDPQSKEFKDSIKKYRELYLEDLFKMTEQLQFFEKVKQYLPLEQKDINKLSPDDLKNIFMNFKLPEKKQKELEKKEAKKTREGIKHAGGQIIFENGNWVVIKIEGNTPTSKDAAIYYGGYKDVRNNESDWCTSGPGLTFFEGYIKNGPLYVIFPQDDKGEVGKRTGLPKERYQFHFPSEQFMDREDKRIDLVDFLNNKAPELKDIFRTEFIGGFTTEGGKKVEVTYPGGKAGTYVVLYGFDELFNNLPDDIEQLIINNTSSQTISLDIPESLGRFVNITALVFKAIVKTLPESIGNLKQLNFLSLPENKNLVSLPESIADLEDLSFINLKDGNPNIKIPERLIEKLNDEGNGFFYVI